MTQNPEATEATEATEPGEAYATTWDGLPIAPERPNGATVLVWRSPAGSAAAELELLVLHRAHHGPDYAGDWAWTPPAGARLPGEAIDTCARRELYEEAGLELEPIRLDDPADDEGWARYVVRAAHDAQVTLHDREHDRFEWVPPETALALISPDLVRLTVRRALDWIRANGDARR